MPLDAFVHCDCFEKNNLRCDPPGDLTVKVEPTGELSCAGLNGQGWSAFLAWKRQKACLHYGMILLRHRLGGAAEIELLRKELEKQPTPLPILLHKVLYSSTHTCDWIQNSLMPQLLEEVKMLDPKRASAAAADSLQLFKIHMAELIIAAQHTGKPICF
jgi:hypothetical protein